MSDDDEMIVYGTLLPQFAEDEIPSKKPITIADQIAVDANGKRRFHGAFTGGFSAGFWNTVGSLEGWQPKSFKSSRGEKASVPSQDPDDFMDDEDKGEYGIAPHRIQTTEEFTDERQPAHKKARISLESEGPIRGNPVKQLFLAPVKGKISINLLRKMGWKDEDGFRTHVARKKAKLREKSPSPTIVDEGLKVYKVDMGPIQKIYSNDNDEDDDDDDSSIDENIEFDSEKIDFRINRFGLGYVGLTKYLGDQPQQHINLFAQIEANEKRKRLPISGQAFGVGAFEDDDDDIYAREDLNSYDFALGERSGEKSVQKALPMGKKSAKIAGCVAASANIIKRPKKIYYVDFPVAFKPTNWAIRKSRFGPMLEQSADSLAKIKSVNLNADTRRIALIGKTKEGSSSAKDQTEESIKDDVKSPPAPSGVPRTDKIRQQYGKSLADKIAFDRFVSEADIDKLKEVKVEEPAKPKTEYEIKVNRTRRHWEPNSILCQKMNIAEPVTGFKKSNKKTFLFFENVAKARKKRRTELDLIPAKEKEFENEIQGIASSKQIPSISKSSVEDNPPLPSTSKSTYKSVETKMSNETQERGTTRPPKPIKKTELELRVDREKDKHPSEKKDLFKSIFSSSEESDGEEEEEEGAAKTKEKSNETSILNPNEILQLTEEKRLNFEEPQPHQKEIDENPPANLTELKPEENTVPTKDAPPEKIQFIKKSDKLLSMLSDPFIFKSMSSKKQTISETSNASSSKDEPVPLIYGPSLPANISKNPIINDSVKFDAQPSSSDDNTKWIDKSESKKRKHKEQKHKKHKKHKSHKSKKKR